MSEQSNRKGGRPPVGPEHFGGRIGGWIFFGLLAVCVCLALSDFLYAKTAHHEVETWPAFQAVYGFVAYLTIVFAANLLRKVVMRDEDYYDD